MRILENSQYSQSGTSTNTTKHDWISRLCFFWSVYSLQRFDSVRRKSTFSTPWKSAELSHSRRSSNWPEIKKSNIQHYSKKQVKNLHFDAFIASICNDSGLFPRRKPQITFLYFRTFPSTPRAVDFIKITHSQKHYRTTQKL